MMRPTRFAPIGFQALLMSVALAAGTPQSPKSAANTDAAEQKTPDQRTPDQKTVDNVVTVGTLAVPSGDGFSLTTTASVTGPYKFNREAPWKLELSQANGTAVPLGTVDFAHTDQKVLGNADLPDGAATQNLRFKLTYFVCDTAQTWCKRSARSGDVEVKSPLKNEMKDVAIAKQSLTTTQPQKKTPPSPLEGSPAPNTQEFDTKIGGVRWKSLPPSVRDVNSARSWVQQLDGPALVYWGAQWCPPCNELKAQVFSHPGFAEATAQLQRFAVDGDAPNAQAASEVLRVSGYPTILILGPKGVELARINESLSFEEFKETVAAALTQQKPMDQRITQALAGQATPDDWRVLAQTRWELERMGLAKSPDEDAQLFLGLFNAAPKADPALRAQFLFAAATGADKVKAPKNKDALAKELAGIAEQSAASAPLAIALRSHFIYEWEAGTKVFASLSKEAQETAQKNWIKALSHIEKAPAGTMSVSDTLWLVYPRLLSEKKDGAVSKGLRAETVDRARKALTTATSSYERKAMVTGAADLLVMVGEFEKAEQILQAELKSADTSWHMYLYSALASLESDRGNLEKSLDYSALANKSAIGNASRFQWATSDLLRSLKQKRPAAQVAPLLDNTYRVLFEIPDPFRGRNSSRVQAIENAMGDADILKSPEVQDIMARYQLKCGTLDADLKTRCLTHFASLIKIDFAGK